MNDSHLDPARRIIVKFDGPQLVSEITGRHVSRVYRWMTAKEKGGTGGVIPQREAKKLLAHASAHNIDLDASEFFAVSSKVEAA